METKYSRTEFEGFTHRFIVKFSVDNDWRNDTNLTLYSNSESYQELEDFINEKKSDRVVNFKIEHRASKEQDEMASKFLSEFLLSGLLVVCLRRFGKWLITVECMSSSRTQTLIRSRNLNINNCNSLKRLTAIAYTLC